MFLKDLLDKIFSFVARKPERQSMQDAGDSNVQIGNVQGNVINQGQQPEINIHIHGVAITAGVSANLELNPTQHTPLNSGEHSANRRFVDSNNSFSKTDRVIDPPEVIKMRRESFSWLERFDGLEVKRLFVYSFMVESFGTKEVMSLNKNQLYRLNRWCAVVYEDRKPKGEVRIEACPPNRQIRRERSHT